MDIDRIRRLATEATNATAAAIEAGIPLRTFMRFRAGGYPTSKTLQSLADWSEGRRLKPTKEQK